MKKYTFYLTTSPEITEVDIYSYSAQDAKINIAIATGCPLDKIFFVEQTGSHFPHLWQH